MCGGREMQGRRPLHIYVVDDEIKQMDSISVKSTDHQEIKRSAVVASGMLICSPRRHPVGASCKGVGLAIVAAIQAELDESEKATSLGSGIKCTAAAPLSPTSSAPAAQISRPIPISLQAQQINPMLAPQKAAYKSKDSRWINHKITPANQRIINNNDKDIAARESIFSTALSPPCNNLSYNGPNLMLSPDFLRACFFCNRPLGPGKDIYMYRGDRAFCTTECRYKQIVVDERKERSLSTACNLNHRLGAAATVAAVC